MEELFAKKCVPCEVGVPPLKGEKLKEMYSKISPSWKLVDEHQLEKEWKFDDFDKVMEFVNKVADIAKKEGHHPDVFFTYDTVKLTLWTHKIDGLFDNDFILAAKIDKI